MQRRALRALLVVTATALVVSSLRAELILGGRVAAPGGDWVWELPPGFPAPRVPADNPMTVAKVNLGRFLFHDTRLSGNGTFACASCHRPELAFTDGLRRSLGSTGEEHPRGAMSLVNAAYNVSLNWADPDTRTLEEQMPVPLFGEEPVELGLAGREDELLDRLRADKRYRAMFGAAFAEDDDPFTMHNVVRAIACFERTLIAADTPYGRRLFGDDRGAMSEAALRGMRLFFSERLRCGECHAGFTLSGPVVWHTAEEAIEPVFHNTGLYDVDGRGSYPADSPGVVEKTGREEDRGRFRAPTLFNVALTAPYMHDGSLGTLEEVIDFYAAGGRRVTEGPHTGDGRANRLKDERIAGFESSASEKRDLVAFLHSLTDDGLAAGSAFTSPFE